MSDEYLREGQFWVSPYNHKPEVKATRSLPAKVQVHDATLRDGEQTPGVVMSVADKIAIAEKMDEAGVDRIEGGFPAVSEDDFQAMKALASRGLKAKIFTFARAMRADVDKALECGADGIVVEVPIGYPKLKYQFNWTWEDVLKKSVDVIRYATERGLYVNYFPYDTTRAREEDLDNLLTRLMQEAPPHSVGVVDTMGCGLPEAIKYMVRRVKALTKLPVEVHTHNDFGMAVATEFAGMEAGAEVLHGCFNGLGERTGNAATEELMVGSQVLYGYDCGYDLAKLPEVGALVSRITGIPIARNKPILGSMNFTRKFGLGVDLVIKQPLAMFATHPALTGREGEIVLGKKSGRASIGYNLERIGLTASDAQVDEMLQQVKKLSIEKRGLVSEDEFLRIVEQVRGALSTEAAE